jgi:hypothetical protein
VAPLAPIFAVMCGRFTRNYTWEQIHALYRLTALAAQPRFNACPTDPADTIVEHDGKRELVEMRWGLVPFWWSKPLKELRLAAFNARVETVTTKPFFREPFKKKRCLMPVSGYYEWQETADGKQPWYFTARDGSPVLTIAGLPAPPTQCRAARRIARSAILRPNRSQYCRVPQQERPQTNRAPDSTAIKEIKFQGVSVRATRKPIVALWTSLVLIVPRNAERNSADLLIQEPFRRTR